MSQLGTAKIEAIVESLKHVAIAAKKISADKKVDLQDIPAAMELLVKLPSIIENVKELGEAWKEVKDIDVAEVVSLIQKLDAAVKQVEAA
jgi:cell division FtsZ-interacting protein ZapD